MSVTSICRLSVVAIPLSLLTLAISASAECAWVLWTAYANAGTSGSAGTIRWEAEAEYSTLAACRAARSRPERGPQQCLPAGARP